MSDVATPTPAPVVTPPAAAPTPGDRLAALEKQMGDTATLLKGLNTPQPKDAFGNPVSVPHVYGGTVGQPGQVPFGTSGPLGDRPYSMLKMCGVLARQIPAEQAKYEIHVSGELRKSYNQAAIGQYFGSHSMLVPYALDNLPCETTREEVLQKELKQKFKTDTYVDPDEHRWMQKALGTNIDTAGGPLVGFPTLGELVDMQRNMESFSNAGASQVPLGPNGQMYYPKLNSGSTAYFVPENPATALSTSQPTTGSLTLMAKTLAVRVPLSNQLLKFNLISAEAMVRLDMARVAALRADLSMFAGVGGNEIKGLLTYDTQTAWASGTDKVIAFDATTTASDGNTLNSIDLYKMIGSLPDQVPDVPGLSWIIKKSYWWNRIATARAGGYAAGDGPYLHSFMRSVEDGITSNRFLGNRLVLTSQVPNRVKGNGTTLTAVILGFFPDWLIGRAGVLELDVNPYGDTAWGNIQTELRLVQYIDAGPRHAASFAYVDNLLTSAFTG